MFALVVIFFCFFIVIFGMSGWLYLDHKRNKEGMENYFKNKYGGFNSPRNS
ncbi:hypothetical protein [Chryseobacterium sp. MP_3.2]|uniref:hypothetical protein n=1 Tax=Chryseobacterium sp. MP_3.2 TaxID=3071712 RepID=UPI002E044397|nr:hypothetical protein [Chryseobacterium sp. MP_3.2]